MNNQSIHDAIDMEELHPSLPMNNALDNEHTEEQYSGDEPATKKIKSLLKILLTRPLNLSSLLMMTRLLP